MSFTERGRVRAKYLDKVILEKKPKEKNAGELSFEFLSRLYPLD
jgi:hypothetical protein